MVSGSQKSLLVLTYLALAYNIAVCSVKGSKGGLVSQPSFFQVQSSPPYAYVLSATMSQRLGYHSVCQI